jgi:hypothetical protein
MSRAAPSLSTKQMHLNPVRIAVTLAYAFADKEQPGNRLRALYDIWTSMRA